MNYIFIGWGPLDWIGDKIQGFFYYILLWLNAIIYSLVGFVYQIFLTITSNEGILDDSVINGFVDRLYIIIGVVTLFIIAYSLLKTMINPDEALKGKKSPVNIIKDVIISIALITLLPTIFDFAFAVQNSLLKYNTIGKLIVGSNTNTSQEDSITQGGYTIAATVWQSFFYPDEKYCTIEQENAGLTSCEILSVGDTTWAGVWNDAAEDRTFFGVASIGSVIMSGDVTYLFIFDILVGLYVLFVLGIYCMDMAVRLVKLSVYQIIAPLPILARIVPNETVGKMFNNWLKATISTFLEVFIRIALLFFAVVIIQSAVKSIDNIFVSNFSGSAGIMVKGVAQILIILGIIKFMKEAPAIIKEITGLDGGKYGKSLIQGAGMLLGGMGTVGTTAIRTAAKNYADTKASGGNKWKAAGAAAGGFFKSAAMQKGFVKGAWGGRKVEKFGDIPKATGKSIASYAAQQRSVEQKGGGVSGWVGYQKAMAGLKKDKALNWIKGDSATEDERLLNFLKEGAQKLDSAEETWKKDPGYVKAKEAYQLTEGPLNTIKEAIQKATQYSGQNLLDSLNHNDKNIRDHALSEVEAIASALGYNYTNTNNELAQKQKQLEDDTKEFNDIILSSANGRDILNHLKHADPTVKAQALAEANRIMQAARGVDYTSLQDLEKDISDLETIKNDIEDNVKRKNFSANGEQLIADFSNKQLMASLTEAQKQEMTFQAEMLGKEKDGRSYVDIKETSEKAKRDLKGTERFVRSQKSKANAAGAFLSQAQNLMAQYSDLYDFSDISNLLKNTDLALNNDQTAAVHKYDAITDPAERRNKVIEDLSAGSIEAQDYMDAYNNLKDFFKRSQTDVINRISDRKAKEEQSKKDK